MKLPVINSAGLWVSPDKSWCNSIALWILRIRDRRLSMNSLFTFCTLEGRMKIHKKIGQGSWNKVQVPVNSYKKKYKILKNKNFMCLVKTSNISSFSWSPFFKGIVNWPLNDFTELATYDPPNHEAWVHIRIMCH